MTLKGTVLHRERSNCWPRSAQAVFGSLCVIPQFHPLWRVPWASTAIVGQAPQNAQRIVLAKAFTVLHRPIHRNLRIST